jgi:hypothetical protein
MYDFQEVGKTCLSPQKILLDIFDEIIEGNFKTKLPFESFYKNSELLINIYLHSVIDQENYYQNCAFISSESSNSQKDIENMEFYVFNNYLIYLHKLLEEKNSDGKNKDDQEQNNPMGQAAKMQQNASKSFASTLNQSKSLLKKH